MRRKRAGALVLVMLGLATACGLDVVGTYVPGAATAGGDGGTTTGSDGGTTTGSDGGGSLPLVDAGTSPDAAVALDAGPAPAFCAKQAPGFVYCNDFEVTRADYGFDGDRTTGGKIEYASTDSVNQALRVVVDEGSASRSVYVSEPLTILEDIVENGFDITYKFSVRKSALQFAVLGGPLLATDPGVTGGRAIGIAAYDDGTRLDYAQSGAFPSVYWLPGDSWHSAWIRHGKAPVGDPFVQVVVDGVVVSLDRVKPDEDEEALVLRLGGYFTSDDPGTLEVLYDDVLVRTF